MSNASLLWLVMLFLFYLLYTHRFNLSIVLRGIPWWTRGYISLQAFSSHVLFFQVALWNNCSKLTCGLNLNDSQISTSCASKECFSCWFLGNGSRLNQSIEVFHKVFSQQMPPCDETMPPLSSLIVVVPFSSSAPRRLCLRLSS